MLDEAEVKRIVQLTIKEMRKQELLRDAESAAYKEISERLHRYYDGEPDDDLRAVLRDVECDRYFDVILLFYCEGHTVESIAEQLSMDVRTISRNKKRLCIELYSKLMF